MSEVQSELIAWVKQRHEEDGEVELDADTDLFGAGLLDSLAYVSLIALLEEMSGHKIDMRKVKIQNIRTIRGICTEFFAERVQGVQFIA